MTVPRLPAVVERLVDAMSGSRGVVAVTLGGSRATGAADDASDWDLGVFYRGEVDLEEVSRHGTVHLPGSWGRFMNGGAWLDIDGMAVDVILRDLDTVNEWSAKARRGEYEVDQLLGYVAGFPSYTLTAEVASSIVLTGVIDVETSYPEALAAKATSRWSFQRDFSLDYARMHAERGDRVAAMGNLVRAAMEEAHRRMCVDRRWVLNEKRLLGAAGLAGLEFDDDPDQMVDRFAARLVG
jgi:hypothetical protein